MTASPDITQLLADLNADGAEATARIVPLVYNELRVLAERALRGERPDHTLGTTALVHEAYLRLIDQRRVRWQHRAHFYGVAAQLMRRILVDYARGRNAAKRGGAGRRVALEEEAVTAAEPAVDLSAIDEALTRLGQLDPQQGRIVELRFFGGLTIQETADVIGVSPATVKREWTVAKAWLRREIGRGGHHR